MSFQPNPLTGPTPTVRPDRRSLPSDVKASFRLDEAGYFTRDGARIMPVGVNYWPASCGVGMWQAWPEEEIQADLRLTRALGLNCVRFFLRWEDFEPEAEVYREECFDRLRDLLGWCRNAGLIVQPTLFVGWMSGGIFWPKWKGGRNAFADDYLRQRAVEFTKRAAEVCAEFSDIVLTVDQGNELCCLPDCFSAPPAAVAEWCRAISDAVREVFPTALVMSGNEQSQVATDSGWRFGAQAGCDLYSIHVYPNSAWHPLRFDGMEDPLTRSLFSFYLKCARAFGPVMAQEFGTLYTDGMEAAGYLDAILPDCHDAGANGFLWWCLRDINARGHPYDKNPFEGGMGLVDAGGNVKPALRRFIEFSQREANANRPDRRPEVALYWPKYYYNREAPLNPGNEPRPLSRRMIIAHFVLGQLGHRVGIERGDLPPGNSGAGVIIVTGALLTQREAEALIPWVKAGGRLLWHGMEKTTWGKGVTELVGAAPTDFLAPRADGVEAFGETWNFREFARDVFVKAQPRTARVIATDRRGRPVILEHALGKGRVVACMAQPDDLFAAESDDVEVRHRWSGWYAGMLGLCGVRSGAVAAS